MNKLYITLLTTIILSFSVQAQSVNGVPIKELDAEFIRLEADEILFSNKIGVLLDFGQEKKGLLGDKNDKLKDTDGKVMAFNSLIEALNFMSKQGFELFQAYAAAGSKESISHFYILRKKKKEQGAD